MQIINTQRFCGRNMYCHRPVMKITVDIGECADKPTKDIKDFNEKLVEYLPGLRKHTCSLGYEGGFYHRLFEGTYMAHVLEHIIIELQLLAGFNIKFGKTRQASEEGSEYNIIFEYVNERCGVESAKLAVDIANLIISNGSINISRLIEDLKIIATESSLGPSTAAIVAEAKKRGIPVMRIGDESLVQLGYGKYSRRIASALTDRVSCISVDIAGNKQITKELLREYNIPVPEGDIVYTENSAVSLANQIGYPVVVKPFDSNQGKGVSLELMNDSQVRAAFAEACKYSKAALVEKYIIGNDYRVLVVGGKVSAVAERKPACVTGDGIHTVTQLIDIENTNLLRGDDHEKPLTKIKLDAVAMQILKNRGMDENHIPGPCETIFLRNNGNLSTGGTARDRTCEIHPKNAEIAVKAAKIIGLDIAGIDITSPDISIPVKECGGAVIEVNAAPGLRMHIYPSEGEKRNVAADIMDMLFPEDETCSIPIASVTGTNGKTTTTRLIGHTMSLMGLNVGMTTTSGIYIGGRCILKGDNTGPLSAKSVLCDKTVEAAVLETARGGLVRKGLGYNLADVGIITNVTDDHLGLDGIDTLEDMAFVKSLVVEAIKPHGYAVLNAEDGLSEYISERVRCNIIYFSKTLKNNLLASHLKSGGTGVYIKEGILIVQQGKNIHPVINIKDIPITFEGRLECNIENALAAAAGLYALSIPVNAIAHGLASFRADIFLNPGRFNLFDMGNFSVLVDYGHNPAGYKAVIDFALKLSARRLVGVIGMPGDRLDRTVRDVGSMCAGAMRKIYIKEDSDLRGRDPGEVAGLLCEGALAGGAIRENLHIILRETKALETAILNALPEDLIVVFYEELEPILEIINNLKVEMEINTMEEMKTLEQPAG